MAHLNEIRGSPAVRGRIKTMISFAATEVFETWIFGRSDNQK